MFTIANTALYSHPGLDDVHDEILRSNFDNVINDLCVYHFVYLRIVRWLCNKNLVFCNKSQHCSNILLFFVWKNVLFTILFQNYRKIPLKWIHIGCLQLSMHRTFDSSTRRTLKRRIASHSECSFQLLFKVVLQIWPVGTTVFVSVIRTLYWWCWLLPANCRNELHCHFECINRSKVHQACWWPCWFTSS